MDAGGLARFHRAGIERRIEQAHGGVELRDICGRIAELIDRFAEADIVLEATLHETLSREALGFATAGQDANDG